MKAKTAFQQLSLIGDHSPNTDNTDLVGRRFFDGHSAVTVVGVCRLKNTQVTVEREMDGKSWSVSAAVIRRITVPTKKKRTA